MSDPIAHIICIKWGQKYDAGDVNRLYAMARRNLHRHGLDFVCFTDDAAGLHPGIRVLPLPTFSFDYPADLKPGYRKEAALCDDALAGLTDRHVLFLDLDVLITDEIDSMIEFAAGRDFVIINDWRSQGDRVGQASCYAWKVGALGYIKQDFERRPRDIVARYGTASQEYLSAMVIERYGRLTFWPDAWCRSFKVHALPHWTVRRWVAPRLPPGVKVLAFHGPPKIEDAALGRWSPKTLPWHQTLYKTIRPAPWVDRHWHDRDLPDEA